MDFLRKEEFELFTKYAGTSSYDNPDAHGQLKRLYCKLGDISDALQAHGFVTRIRRNPLNQGQKFEEYHWAQLCPSYCPDAEWKIFFVIDFTAKGFGTHIDCNQRKGLWINERTEKLQFWEDLSVEKVCELDKDEIVNWVLNYCNRHKKDFLQFGKEYNIVSCMKLLNMETYNTLLVNNRNLILTSAPGTGKTFLAKQIAAQMILGKSFDENTASEEEKEKMKEQYDFVQFHPSYDYTDFMEGLRPIDNKGNISFRREDGIFMKFCRKALNAYNKEENKDEAPKYIFVIDEINRGDLSKIFGELFFSIDPGYRGVKGKVKTQYCNLWKTEKFGDTDSFYIPENVYIIGTMNDIDRSVESMDFAMRRRFAFKEVRAEDRMEMIEESAKLAPFFSEIKERMDNLNYAILTIQGLSTAYQIGAAYFLKLENYLTNDEKLETDSWKSLWDNHLYGLLFEYLRGLPNAEGDLDILYRAYTLEDKYKMENKKAIKIPSQDA